MAIFLSLLAICELCRRIERLRDPLSKFGKLLWICSLVLSWYAVSITLILFNKFVLSIIDCPTFYTMTHMFAKGVFALIYFYGAGKTPKRVSYHVLLGLSFAGVFAALDIMCANLSLLTLSASFYTFLKSSALVFVLIIGVVTFVEPLSWNIVSTVSIVTAGMFLMSYGEADFEVQGVVLVLLSELFAAFRWIVTQMIVQGQDLDALSAVLYMCPGSSLALIPLVIARETKEILSLPQTAHDMGLLGFGALFLIPGLMAFLLLVIEVQLVIETSSLTLTVFGNLKSVVTVLFSVAIFGDKVSVLQWVGMFVVGVGLLAYSQARGEWLAEDAFEKVIHFFLGEGDSDHSAGDGSRSKDSPEETTPLLKHNDGKPSLCP